MRKINTLALVVSLGAAFVAGNAGAAELRVSLAGKSAKEAHAEILKAASTVCWQDVRSEALAVYLYPACVRASVKDAVARVNNPELAAYTKTASVNYYALQR
ncbi:hypothetical protein [Caulobacter sp. NIBR2454]|uniref:hypothetical protein n=1 Tax=Caulobacter sp. NIBR2454 TaxID=3015996 RepID=UPI0022B739DA|nr:hypothetical protein [Caulobacter sp. NIBR2454]